MKKCPACNNDLGKPPQGADRVMNAETTIIEMRIIAYCDECDAWIAEEL